MKINNKLWKDIVEANFESGFELIDNNYSGRNYWRKGHTSLNALKWGTEGCGVDKEEKYQSKDEVIRVIEKELIEDIERIASGDYDLDTNDRYDRDLIKTLASLIIR